MVLKKCPHKDCESEEITIEQEEVHSKEGFFNPRNIIPKKPIVMINCKKCGKFPYSLEEATRQKEK